MSLTNVPAVMSPPLVELVCAREMEDGLHCDNHNRTEWSGSCSFGGRVPMNVFVFDLEEWETPAFAALQRDHRVRLLAGSLTAQNASQFSDADVVSTALGTPTSFANSTIFG